MIGLQSFIKNFKQFKILIIDDEAPFRRTVRSILNSLGFENFREAEDGDDGLRKIRGESFAFVFSDWAMPLISGLELLHTMRQDPTAKLIPVVFVISDSEESLVRAYLDTTLESCLLKPLLPQTVEDKMVEMLFKNLTPSALEVHLQNAGAFMAKGQYRRAHQELDKAAAINKRGPMVNYFRQLVYMAEGRPEQAAEAIQKARQAFAQIVSGPRIADERIAQGRKKLSEGRMAEARDDFAQALESDPDNSDRQVEIGEAYLAQGLAEEAEKIFKASLEANPELIYLYNRLGMAYRRQRKFAEAVASYQKALSLDPQEENIHYNLARAYLAAGDRTQAIAALNSALKLLPDFKEARDLRDRLIGS